MVESTWVIYGLRCNHSQDYRYIGMTKKSASSRLKTHQQRSKLGHGSAKYDWMRSHSVDEVLIEVIEVCTPMTREFMSSRERYWIAHYLDLGHPLLNHTRGGDGGDTSTGRKLSEETKRKLSEAKLGVKRTEADKAAVKESLRNHTFGETCCVLCRREFRSPKGCANHRIAVHLGGNEKRRISVKKSWELRR